MYADLPSPTREEAEHQRIEAKTTMLHRTADQEVTLLGHHLLNGWKENA